MNSVFIKRLGPNGFTVPFHKHKGQQFLVAYTIAKCHIEIFPAAHKTVMYELRYRRSSYIFTGMIFFICP